MCVCVCVCVCRYNEAEYLVDFVTEADRQGRGEELAMHYEVGGGTHTHTHTHAQTERRS